MLLLHGLGATDAVWRGWDGLAPVLAGHGARDPMVSDEQLGALVADPGTPDGAQAQAWQTGHQNSRLAEIGASCTGVPQTRHGRPARP